MFMNHMLGTFVHIIMFIALLPCVDAALAMRINRELNRQSSCLMEFIFWRDWFGEKPESINKEASKYSGGGGKSCRVREEVVGGLEGQGWGGGGVCGNSHSHLMRDLKTVRMQSLKVGEVGKECSGQRP